MLRNATAPIAMPTYDGSGQCVHPEVIPGEETPFDAKYVMVMEPYPFAQAEFENPSIVVSDDGISWNVPSGIINPVVPPKIGGGWHSDATLLARPNGPLHLYYRYNSGAGSTGLLLRTTEDGCHWSIEEQLLCFPVSNRFASPTLISRGSETCLIFVDTLTQTVEMLIGNDGRTWTSALTLLCFPRAWHASARLVDGVLHLLITDQWNLYLLRWVRDEVWEIRDGATWLAFTITLGYVPAFLKPSPGGWDAAMIYHGSFVEEGGYLNLWYSAKAQSGAWGIGYTHGQLGQ